MLIDRKLIDGVKFVLFEINILNNLSYRSFIINGFHINSHCKLSVTLLEVFLDYILSILCTIQNGRILVLRKPQYMQPRTEPIESENCLVTKFSDLDKF